MTKNLNNLLSVTALALSLSQANAADISVERNVGSETAFVNIQGEIVSGDADRFLMETDGIQEAFVFLESPGGLTLEGLAIAAEISLRGYTTAVAPRKECYSSCALIWVAGKNRMMDETSTIGVHAAYVKNKDVEGSESFAESGVGNADIGAFLAHAGLSREAILYFTTAGPNEFLPITPEIAQRLDIDTAVTRANAYERVQDRPTPRLLARQVTDLIGMQAKCADFFNLDGGRLRQQADERLKLGHDLFGGEVYVDLLAEFSALVKSEIAAVGARRWCLSTEANLRRGGLFTGLNGPSYSCGKASTQTEHAICNSPELWMADRGVSVMFNILSGVSSTSEKRKLNRRQREWITKRDTCVADVRCISDRYEAWFLDITALVEGF